MKKVYSSSEFSTAPLSAAQEANGFVFVSGQIHIDKNLNLIGETIEEKFSAAVANVERILAEAELTKSNIIQVRLYLTNLDELPALNEVYKQYFQHPLPARTAIGVSKLPLGASLEIEVVASR